MFERITVRNNNPNNPASPLDIGLILETMLFYGKVIVILDGANALRQIIKVFGIENIKDLIDENILDLVYFETITGIRTQYNGRVNECYDPVIGLSPQHSFQIELYNACIENAEKSGKGRRDAIALLKRIRVDHHDEKIINSTKKTMLDHSYVCTTTKSLLKSWIPELPDAEIENSKFLTFESEHGLVVETDLNYVKINNLYHKTVSTDYASINNAFILSIIYDVELDLYMSAFNLSEIVSTQQKAAIIEKRFAYIGQRVNISKSQREVFEEHVLTDIRSVREAYNKGQIEISAIIKAIMNATQFKKWLYQKPMDANILKEYLMETSRSNFMERIPVKVVKWSAFTGAGIILDALGCGGVGTAIGLGLSFIDGFVLDNLISGWKPSQYIDKYLNSIKVIK